MKSVVDLNLDGRTSHISVDAAALETVHMPVLRDLEERWRRRRGRFIVFLSGPPGSGKTTLSALWEKLARQGRIEAPVQALPMDGFHYPNRVLDSQQITVNGTVMPLRRIKGRPESFDLPAIQQLLRTLRAGEPLCWPRYDRTLHDPVPDAIPVLQQGIVIVEGLYMLLDPPGWKDLRAGADRSIFLECPDDVSRADLLARSSHKGQSSKEAAAHYELVDQYTWQLTMHHRHGIDVLIRIGAGRHLEIIQ